MFVFEIYKTILLLWLRNNSVDKLHWFRSLLRARMRLPKRIYTRSLQSKQTFCIAPKIASQRKKLQNLQTFGWLGAFGRKRIMVIRNQLPLLLTALYIYFFAHHLPHFLYAHSPLARLKSASARRTTAFFLFSNAEANWFCGARSTSYKV